MPGSLDPTFADGGIVYLSSPFASGGKTIHGVTLGDGGVIYAIGEVASTSSPPTDVELLALESNGELVRTFAGAGRATYGIFGPQTAEAVTTLADGTILSAGWTPDLSTSSPIAATQNAKGELTPAGDGVHVLDGGGPGALAYAAASDGTNRYIGGLERGGQAGNCMRVWKLTRQNVIDETFAGTIPTSLVAGGLPGVVTDLATESDGRILVAANAPIGNPQLDAFVAARLTKTGDPDPTFGDGGAFVQFLPTGASIGFESIARQGTTIIVVASLAGPGSRDVGVFRLDANGHALDTTFGTAGSGPRRPRRRR